MTQRKSNTLLIEGGHRLHGTVAVSGSKNATLGAMAAALTVPEDCVLQNVPDIGDVEQMAQVLRSLGASVDWAGQHVLHINAAKLHSSSPAMEYAGTLRGSFLVMGALLGRLGEASCPQPGGDVIGQRPIDVHLAGFAALGAEVSRDGERFIAHASKPLEGATIFADYPSVLGTQNLMLAAATARGRTRIVNAAAEPEVQGTAQMLIRMGARISGAGTHTVEIEGVESLRGCEFEIIPDVGPTGTTTAIISGPTSLHGARVQALDVRAGAALILAGLAAVSGRSEVTDVYHVDRGYERLDEKLRSLGARIERV